MTEKTASYPTRIVAYLTETAIFNGALMLTRIFIRTVSPGNNSPCLTIEPSITEIQAAMLRLLRTEL